MKKNYTFYTVLLLIPLAAFLFLGYSSGQTGNYSGSPGDGGNTCTVCHTVGANNNASVSIQTDIPATGYELNHTYIITVSGTSSVTKHGFQITAEKTGGNKVGTFTAGSGSQTADLDHLVTHTTAGNMQSSWTFSWTSPSTDQGAIIFYAALNAANSDGSTTGDQIVTTNVSYSSTVGIADYNTLQFTIYPNPTVYYMYTEYECKSSKASYSIIDIQGRLIEKSDYSSNQMIDVSSLNSGVYFITITDGSNKGVMHFVKK